MSAADAGPIVLVVEDEDDLRVTVEYNLRKAGYRVRSAATGRAALAQAAIHPPPDLVLLDLMLPDLSGTEVCRQLRQAPGTRDTPVVMVTARTEEIDRIVGFEVGADDYVTKPFSVRELMLRVRAVLRRTATPDSAQSAIVHQDLTVDPEAHEVRVGGGEVELTALEFRLLCTLLERRGRVQTRELLLSDVWGYSPETTTRTVDTHVRRLRAKLGEGGRHVETVRGVGYRIRSEGPQ